MGLICGVVCGVRVQEVTDPDTRRKLLDFFVEKIYICPDKVALAFYCADDRRELPSRKRLGLSADASVSLIMTDSPRPKGIVPARQFNLGENAALPEEPVFSMPSQPWDSKLQGL